MTEETMRRCECGAPALPNAPWCETYQDILDSNRRTDIEFFDDEDWERAHQRE